MARRSIRQMRRRILLEIRSFNQQIGAGPNDYVAPHTLKCFKSSKTCFLAAANELLQQGLLVGVEVSTDKEVAIRLNLEKIGEINAELAIREWYQGPRFVIPTLLAIVGAVIAAIKLLIG